MLSLLVVCYLFLGGLGAGICCVATVLGLMVPSDAISRTVFRRQGARYRAFCAPEVYRRLFFPAFMAALVILLIAVTCLAADLGRADRVFLLLLHPTASYIALGTYALMACIVLGLLCAWAWGGGAGWRLGLLRVLQVVTLIVALVVMVYTGLMLQSLQAVPLWATPWLPVLFVLSSLSCGAACLLGMAQVNGMALQFAGVMRRLVVADAVVIVLEVLAVAALVASVGVSGAGGAGGEMLNPTAAAAVDAVRNLLWGQQAYLFWAVFILAGLAVPLLLDIVLARASRSLPMVALAASGCVLAGGFVLRFCIVEAGLHPALMMPVIG